jgi:hypothetical protein
LRFAIHNAIRIAIIAASRIARAEGGLVFAA